MKPIITALLFAVLVLPSIASLQAQDDANPLLDMLVLVPDHPDVYESTPVISYADYRAIETARGISTPTVQDFNDQTETSALWIAASTGLVSGPDFVRNVFTGLERTPDLLGFSFFDIDRDLNAALNILARGLASLPIRGIEAPGFSRRE